MIETDNLGTAGTPNVVLAYAWDAAGRRTSAAATIDGVADFANQYTYDALGRMTGVTQTDAAPSLGYQIADKRVDLAYDALGRFQTIARYEDLAGSQLVALSTWVYDDAGRLTSLDHTQGTTTLAFYDWTYDAAGRLTGFASLDGAATYAYDDTGQLTAADYDFQSDEAYTYDENGNRTNTGYVTGTNNRLLSDGTFNYEYDAEGNRVKRTDIASGDYVTYEWDHKNQLTAVAFFTSAGVLAKRVEYDYDPHGRRIGKRTDDDGDGAFDRAERFVYDAAGKLDPATGVPLDDVVLVFDEAGSLTNRYLHGPAVDQVFADEDAMAEILWGLGDNQGTIRDVADYDAGTDTTSIANHRQFDSFGNLTAETNAAVDFAYAYTGRYLDEDTGLQYNRARWYDPATGRWLSPDPSGLEPDTNQYRYVGNGATNLIDPSGLEGYWEGVGNVFLGYGDAAWGTCRGLYQIVRHPIQTGQGVVHAVANPGQTIGAIVDDAIENSRTTRGQGRLVGDVLIGVATGGTIKSCAKTAKIAKLAEKVKRLGRRAPDGPEIRAPGVARPRPRGRAPEFPGGRVSESGFLDAALEFLGPGYREASPGRWISADGMRQVRFGSHEVRGPRLHGHFEAYDRPYGSGGRVIENTVVDIIPD